MVDRVANFVLSGVRTFYYNYAYLRSPAIDKWLSFPTEGNTYEVPYISQDIIFAPSFMERIKSLAIPLVPSAEFTTRRLVRGALIDFSQASSRGLLQGVHMASGNTYFGLPGVIFDNDMNLLMIMTITVGIQDTNMSIESLNCRISPKVIEHQDRIIEKTIIKKVLPFCATHTIASWDFVRIRNPYVYLNCVGKGITVIIEDCNKFIHTPSIPKPSTLTPDKIKEFLIRNENEISP